MVGDGAHGSRHQLHDDVDDDVDAFSKEELARRPEVRLINRYAVFRTYVIMLLKGIGGLLLLWATVVLLGGYVSSLKKIDFWYISFIAFVYAAGFFNAMFDNQLKHLMIWMFYAMKKLILHSSRVKHNQVDMHRHQVSWTRQAWPWRFKKTIRSIVSKVIALIVFAVLELVMMFSLYGPIFCAWLSLQRLKLPDYGSAYKDATQDKDNLKRGLDLFYFVCAAQGLTSLIVILIEIFGTIITVNMVRRQVRLSREVVLSYCIATKQKCMNNLASSDESWNFITYGAGLLDSEMPEDNASGARVLSTLIELGVPVRQLLLRSTRHRIQKLLATLAWRGPADGEMRWLAARIVEHIAPDLSLAQFPGALECISSLLETSGYNKDDGDSAQDQEDTYLAAQLRLHKQQSKQKKHLIIGNPKEKEQVSINSAQGRNEELIILQGLRILENLALHEHNCRVICSSDAVFSKIIAPLNYENSMDDMEKNTSWAKVTEASLKLLSRLMRSPGDTGKEIHRKVALNTTAVNNLDNVLGKKTNSCNIIMLQIRAVEILEQLYSGDGDQDQSTSTDSDRQRREKLITKLLPIFLPQESMTRAAVDGERETESQKEAVNHLKEKAGKALATLCRVSFTGASQDAVRRLTEMLDSEESTIRCRIWTALILKHLCTHCTLDLGGRYLRETTLKKVLNELLHKMTKAQAASTEIRTQWWRCWRSISERGNDIENQRGDGHSESQRLRLQTLHLQEHKQQREERRLQVALLSLCAAICERWIGAPEFAAVVAELASPKDVVEKLKKLVEENRYATPSCRAIVKLTCELVIALMPHGHSTEEVKMKEDIVGLLCEACKTMAGLESCMLFAGTEYDCYGIPVKPFCSDRVEKARQELELLKKKGQQRGLNIV